MSVDETLMCSFNILKPADKKTNAQRPKTPKVAIILFVLSLLLSYLQVGCFLNTNIVLFLFNLKVRQLRKSPKESCNLHAHHL